LRSKRQTAKRKRQNHFGQNYRKANGKQQKENSKTILGKIVKGVFVFNATFPRDSQYRCLLFSVAVCVSSAVCFFCFLFAVCFLLFISPAHKEI
jgi:hypothetical protein